MLINELGNVKENSEQIDEIPILVAFWFFFSSGFCLKSLEIPQSDLKGVVELSKKVRI